VKLPEATPVIVTVQVPDAKVQLAPTVPTLVSDEVNVTVPLGVFAEVVVSETATEQEPVRPAVTELGHMTLVEVLSKATVIVLIPLLPLWTLSPP
jgi:hypothetical protein